MAFTRKTEVRHISQAELIKIAEILNQPSTSPAWKKVMQIVPYELSHPEQLSDCRPKYNFQNIKSIETAGAKLNNAAQIFLEEWITSGRIRPTLSHLLHLLVKSELFRAADYVAINLLSEAPPQRPSKGPAAKIDISLNEDDAIDHGLLNGNYPNTSEIMNLNKCYDSGSKNNASKQIFDRSLMPDRPMSEEDLIRMAAPLNFSQNVTATPQSTHATNDFSPPEICASRIQVTHGNVLPSQQQLSNRTNPSAIESSPLRTNPAAQFDSSAQSSHNCVPNFALLNIRYNASNNSSSPSNGVNVPNLSILNIPTSDASGAEQRESFDGIVPHLSELLQQHSKKSNGSTSAIELSSSLSTTNRSVAQIPITEFYPSSESSHNYIPHISRLDIRSNASNNSNAQPNYVEIPNLSILNGSEQRDSFVENVPHLSQLLDTSQSTSVSPTTGENEEYFVDNVPHLSQLMNQ